MNWTELLTSIRVDLNDTAATKRFSDSQLYLWTVDALRDYSTYLPLFVERASLTRVSDFYPLPSDYLRDVFVECPKGTFLERNYNLHHMKNSASTRVSRYSIIGSKLYLDRETDDVVLLSYEALHPVPSSITDTTWTLTIPLQDVELIRLYVKGKALEMIRAQQSNLDRFTPGSGNRQDNPLHPEVSTIMNDYRERIFQRIAGNTVMLYRVKR